MNTNRLNNKNLKRIAVAAGTTAAALFLSAGLVACGGNASDTAATPAQAAELTEVLEKVVAEVAPVVEAAPAIATPVAPTAAAKPAVSAAPKSGAKSTKASKKKSAAVGGAVILDAPTASVSAPAVGATVAPAPQHADAIVATPTEQRAVEQPAAQQQPAVEQAPAAASAPTSSGSTSAITVPKLTIIDSTSSALKGIDLTKTTSPVTAPRICIPGYNC